MRRAALVLATVLAVPGWASAQTTVDQKRPAAPDGTVSIENMAGTIKVTGWDRAEVQVKGTVGAGGELSFEGTGKSTHIEIESDRNPMGVKSDLEVYVPAGSSVEIEGFQATISAVGVTGSVKAETVNGSITQSGAAKNVELQSVNGDVDVTKAHGRVKAESVNGSVVLHDASGELEASTVHGKLHVLGGSWQRAEIESVAGTVRFEAALSPRATLSIETVSGAVQLVLPAGDRRRVRGVELQRRRSRTSSGPRPASPASGRRRPSSTSRRARAARASRSRRCRARSRSASGRKAAAGQKFTREKSDEATGDPGGNRGGGPGALRGGLGGVPLERQAGGGAGDRDQGRQRRHHRERDERRRGRAGGGQEGPPQRPARRQDRRGRARGRRDDLRRLPLDRRQGQRVRARQGRPHERARQRRQRRVQAERPGAACASWAAPSTAGSTHAGSRRTPRPRR